MTIEVFSRTENSRLHENRQIYILESFQSNSVKPSIIIFLEICVLHVHVLSVLLMLDLYETHFVSYCLFIFDALVCIIVRDLIFEEKQLVLL